MFTIHSLIRVVQTQINVHLRQSEGEKTISCPTKNHCEVGANIHYLVHLVQANLEALFYIKLTLLEPKKSGTNDMIKAMR